MFFRLFSGGHYGEIKNVPQAVLDKIPSNVELIYWDYYATDYSYYDKMVKSHQKMSGNIGFAGGAWKWTGFTPHNDFSLRTMKLSVKACRENGVKDYFVTSWGDNGGEGMLNSVAAVLLLHGHGRLRRRQKQGCIPPYDGYFIRRFYETRSA